MRHVTALDFGEKYLLIRYWDDDDPGWVRGRELAVDWRKNAHIERLAPVSYHIAYLVVENPDALIIPDEVLQEWLGRLFDEHPAEGHENP